MFAARIDTIDIINPVTFELEKRSVTFPVDSDAIRGIKFIQEWHWDKSKNTIASKLLAIAPLLTHVDASGNFLYQASLFYRRLGE